MAQSLANILIHVIYSTKDRAPVLAPELRGDLTAFTIGTLQGLSCPSLATAIVADHLHVLLALSRAMSVADVVQQLKGATSKWIKARADLHLFHWQSGYGAFSVSVSNRDAVVRYIMGQDEHHRTHTFQDEYRQFLVRHMVDYDEKYVWD